MHSIASDGCKNGVMNDECWYTNARPPVASVNRWRRAVVLSHYEFARSGRLSLRSAEIISSRYLISRSGSDRRDSHLTISALWRILERLFALSSISIATILL